MLEVRGARSVEVWHTTALEIEESLSGAVDSHVHVLMWLCLLILLIEGFWTGSQ